MALNEIDILNDLKEKIYNAFYSSEHTVMNNYTKDIYEQEFRKSLQEYLERLDKNLVFDIVSNYDCENNLIKINIIPKDEYTKRFLEYNGYYTNDIQLFNGDCLEVMKTIPDKSIDMICCDLPYEISACKWDKLLPLDKLWEQYNRIIKDNGNIVLFSKQPFTTILNNSNLKMFKYELIWCKQQATNPLCAKKRIMPIHENISVFYKKLGTYNPQMIYGKGNYSGFKGDKNIGEVYGNNKSIHRECLDGSRYPTSVLYYNNTRKALHPTQKPLDLVEYLIKTYSNEGDTVLDNCMGSGTTGVACKNLNRNFIGIEIDEKYFDIAKERIDES